MPTYSYSSFCVSLPPTRTKAGESICHIPSAARTHHGNETDTSLMTISLQRLQQAREHGLKVYNQVHHELVRQENELKELNTREEIVGVVAKAVTIGWMKASIALTPTVTRIHDTADCDHGTNTPADEHADISAGKMMIGSFVEMTSPSYWSKKLAGGDPQESLDESIRLIDARRAAFMRKIDSTIRQHERALAQAATNE